MEATKNYIAYFDEKYPSAEDCATLKIQIASIEKDILDLKQKKVVKTSELYTIFNKKFSPITAINESLKAQLEQKTLEYLYKILIQKRSNFELSKCNSADQLISTTSPILNTTQQTIPNQSAKSKSNLLVIAGIAGVFAIGITIYFTRKK